MKHLIVITLLLNWLSTIVYSQSFEQIKNYNQLLNNSCQGVKVDTPYHYKYNWGWTHKRIDGKYQSKRDSTIEIDFNTGSYTIFSKWGKFPHPDTINYPNDSAYNSYIKLTNNTNKKVIKFYRNYEPKRVYKLNNIALKGVTNVFQINKFGECCGCSHYSTNILETDNGFITLADLFMSGEYCEIDNFFLILPVCVSDSIGFTTTFTGIGGLYLSDKLQQIFYSNYPKKHPENEVFAIVYETGGCLYDEENGGYNEEEEILVYSKREIHYYHFDGLTSTLINIVDFK